jgi:PAS domain S-box-containing protein
MTTKERNQLKQEIEELRAQLAVFAKAAPLLDEAGRPRGAVGAFLDITKLNEAEKALRESRAKYQALTETTSDFIWEMDAQGRYAYCSPQMERLWGLKPSDMIGRSPFDLSPADHKDRDVELFRTLMESPQPFNGIETTSYDSHGRLIHIEISGVPFFDDSGELLGFRGITRDITLRKSAEESLTAAHRQTQSIIDNATSIVYALDLEQRFVLANTALAELLNSTPERMIGKRRHEFMPKEDADWHEANDRRVVEAGKPLEFEEHSQLKGRSITWLTTKFPLRDALGKIYAIAGISADISERKRVEAQLRDSEERLQLTLRASDVGTFEVDLANGVTQWNAVEYELLGLKPGDAPGAPETLFRYVHPQDIAELSAQWEQAKRTGRLDAEFRIIRADGQERWLAGKGQFAFAKTADAESADKKQSPLRFLGVNFDITERKQAEEALRVANEELEARVQERTRELAVRANQLRVLAGELTISEQRERKRLASLLHDHLQQLLVGAKFRLSVLKKTGDEGTRLAAAEIDELMNESIKSSRFLTAELSPPILHDAGINAGLEWLGRRMADTQGLLIDLTTEPIEGLPEDMTILLFESVRELLFNVAKHANTNAANIQLATIDGALQITISDRGVGFDSNSLPQAGAMGTGFGLFSIRERIGLFGGKLEIESAPGQGSRFVITMPIPAVESKPQESPELPKEIIPNLFHKTHPGKKIRVLLADDHAVVRQGISNLLSDEADIEVVGSAADGQEVVSLIAKLLPDVILMDVNMPKLNGIEATRIIHSEYSEISIIGLSMFEEAEKAQAMHDAGAVNYLTKSGPAVDLITAIRTAVKQDKKGLSGKTSL